MSKKIFGRFAEISIEGGGVEKNSKINKRGGTFNWHSRVLVYEK